MLSDELMVRVHRMGRIRLNPSPIQRPFPPLPLRFRKVFVILSIFVYCGMTQK